MQADIVLSTHKRLLRQGGVFWLGRRPPKPVLRRCSAPEAAAAHKALGHPALDFVGEASAGEAEMKGDGLLRLVLPPLQEPAEQTGPGAGTQRTAVREIGSMGEDGHVRSPAMDE